MKDSVFIIEYVRRLTRDTWELVLSGDTSDITAPGQFVNLSLPGFFLRRPISVCSWSEGALLLLVKEAGAGTKALVRLAPGTAVQVLTGLGNGFDPAAADDSAILVGGGIGTAPLYGLAKALKRRGLTPTVALGFRAGEDALYLEEFAALGCDVALATEDGSLGIRGFVTDLLRNRPERTYVFACGPTPMLRAVHALPHLTGGQFSFEARMGCGFGACMGCSMAVAGGGSKRVCRDGPIFYREELVW